MCVICILTGKNHADAKKQATREFYKQLAATVASVKDGGVMAEFYVKLMRETADDIENNMSSARTVANVLVTVEKELSAKKLIVEAMLLGAESGFYQQYGMPMPHPVREKLTTEFWDSLEKE